MPTIFKAIGLVLIMGLAVVIGVFFLWFFVVLIALMALMFGLAYLCDVRFKVTSEGKHVGYYSRKRGFTRF
jgi:hypothetical protein